MKFNRKICRATSLIILFFNVHALSSWAGTTSAWVYSPAGPVQLYTSQVDFSQFLSADYKRQEENEWCWAACVSMVFSFHGHPVAQSRIVSSVYGAPIDAPAGSGAYILGVLNRVWTDDNGKKFKSTVRAAYDFDGHLYAINNGLLVAELDKGNPVVIGAGGHAMVLTSMQYTGSPLFPTVAACGVFDPWPGIGPRGLTPAEMFPMDRGGKFRFAAIIKVDDVSSDDSDSTSSSVASTGNTDDTSSVMWEDEGADSSDIDLHSTVDWGDQHSGTVTARVRIKNSSDDDTYKVEVKVAVVKKDRSTQDISGAVDSATHSVVLSPNSTRYLTYHLKWATDEWQPNAEEMPAIAKPESDTDYSSVHIWKKIAQSQ